MSQQDLFGNEVEGRGRPTNLSTLEHWLERDSPSALWWDGYLYLRSKGVRYRDAVLATWLSLGTDDRGVIETREDLARVLGVARSTTYSWEAKRPVRKWAELLRIMRLRGFRLAEVDRRTYDAAVDADSSAIDRKLYYQRAGVWEEDLSVTVRGDREEPVQYVDVTDDELEAIQQALKREAEGSGETG